MVHNENVNPLENKSKHLQSHQFHPQKGPSQFIAKKRKRKRKKKKEKTPKMYVFSRKQEDK